MNTMELLTLLLVIFAALPYIDNHRKRYKKDYSLPLKVNHRGRAILTPLLFLSTQQTAVH
ncbi:hypothetical protein [Anaerotignum sp. MSJ-24]|uniref:hypothetical protein n=1 Tax=Anaerotignum sp. MSJ-24 TaxID=2841521 RepID=UPI001C116FAC|nr:hypothetical protein [Anaerotignum sp. MSJ-24]MBU5464348.1 hypothetical protein [Anaerotignum sp. MSJ-24]